ncbi:catalase [Soonwooa sp.]|uniref:catalase n=1 Tax=Soonwooa sp. TaxID=1938592 RepID=UPI0028ADF382|nr:catalase [Soonwooa sp.]
MKFPIAYHPKFDSLTPRENDLLEQTLTTVSKFVNKSGKISKVKYSTRDAHAKSYSYLKGRFIPSKDENLKEFFPENEYNALVRLSHANLKISKSDRQLPLFGFALKIDDGSSTIANYPLVNFPLFMTKSVSGFLKVFMAINRFFAGSIVTKPFQAFKILISGAPMAFETMNWSFVSAIRNWIESFKYFILARSYYSVGAYRLGNKIIKIKAIPLQFDPEFSTGISILEDVKSYISKNDLKYKILYQIAYDEKYQPINNLTKDWRKTDFLDFGIIEFEKVLEETNLELEQLSFNPFDSKKELQPVGKIQQIRKKVYERSIETRNHNNEKI